MKKIIAITLGLLLAACTNTPNPTSPAPALMKRAAAAECVHPVHAEILAGDHCQGNRIWWDLPGTLFTDAQIVVTRVKAYTFDVDGSRHPFGTDPNPHLDPGHADRVFFEIDGVAPAGAEEARQRFELEVDTDCGVITIPAFSDIELWGGSCQ